MTSKARWFWPLAVAHVRFWTFHVADMGITFGAVLLMFALGRWGGAARARG